MHIFSKLQGAQPLSAFEKKWVALMATWVAGFVDATGYMLLAHIYTANMSGNSVSLAIGATHRNGGEVMYRGWPILAYFTGLVISAIILETCARRGIKSASSFALFVEAASLSAAMLMSPKHSFNGELHASAWIMYGLVGLLALGMGVQNAAITRLGALTVRTTHVTGTLSQFAESFSKYLFWANDEMHRRSALKVLRASRANEDAHRVILLAGLWIAFVVGGICGAVLEPRWQLGSLVAPVAALAALIVIDLLRPIAASNEQPGM